jgi:hypothetical protein
MSDLAVVILAPFAAIGLLVVAFRVLVAGASK